MMIVKKVLLFLMEIRFLSFQFFGQIQKFDLVFCLGDRFEMSAAVQASIPFGLNWLISMEGKLL